MSILSQIEEEVKAMYRPKVNMDGRIGGAGGTKNMMIMLQISVEMGEHLKFTAKNLRMNRTDLIRAILAKANWDEGKRDEGCVWRRRMTERMKK